MGAYSTYSRTSKKRTPQRTRANEREVKNTAGGYVYPVDEWTRLDRFLILGTEGGTYYASQRKMTNENAAVVDRCLNEDATRTIERIVEISKSGRAPKNDPALLALALAASHKNEAVRREALLALPAVARIGTHLFHFVQYAQNQRGWGKGLCRAISRWYDEKTMDKLVYQLIKYQRRDDWSTRDVFRKAHPVASDPERNRVYRWATHGLEPFETGEGKSKKTHAAVSVKELPEQLQAFEAIKKVKDVKDAVRLIQDARLPREAIPTGFLNDIKVWDTLLVDMPYTAMLRNLGKMSNVGLLKGLSKASKTVISRLVDEEVLEKARVHPLSILVALNTYKQGHGQRGSLSWTPVQSVVDALDEAFYKSFKFVEPTGRNLLLALDVSASMSGPELSGMPGITPRVGSAALSMVTARTEQNYEIVGFTSGGWTGSGQKGIRSYWSYAISPIKISPRQRLDTVLNVVSRLDMGGTDCALPMLYATANKLEVDTFVVYTDNETWAGNVHPDQALREYRQKMGRAAKLVVVGMTSNGFSIGDPDDAGMLSVVGFDVSAPSIISDFIKE